MKVFSLYLGISIVTFLVYLSDKSSARKDQWRTPEKTLHLLGLIGGWPGALIAQKLLRHKNRKLSFQIVFWITVLLNCSGVLWLLSPSGSRILHGFI
jgi:uncharacterized membrane protein YsdA (DUF1294 family)